MPGFLRRRRGGACVDLTEEQKRELALLEVASLEAQAKRTNILREAARSQGVVAESLDELKSESGKLFIERENGFGGYRQASCNSEDGAILEVAYLCRPRYMPDGPGCGWVIGEPVEQEYNNIGLLSGSAGTRYYCRICGQEIAEFATMFS